MYYLSFDNSVRNTERKPFFESWCSHCGYSQPTGKCFQKQRKYKGNNKSTVNSNNSNDKHIKHKSCKPNYNPLPKKWPPAKKNGTHQSLIK